MLHNNVTGIVFFARIVDGQNIRMLQHPHHVSFVEEHLAGYPGPLFVVAGILLIGLYRDVAAVVGIMGQIDSTGTSAANFIDDHVFTDFAERL